MSDHNAIIYNSSKTHLATVMNSLYNNSFKWLQQLTSGVYHYFISDTLLCIYFFFHIFAFIVNDGQHFQLVSLTWISAAIANIRINNILLFLQLVHKEKAVLQLSDCQQKLDGKVVEYPQAMWKLSSCRVQIFQTFSDLDKLPLEGEYYLCNQWN